MIVLGYFLVSFVIFFFRWKKYSPELYEKKESYEDLFVMWEFWKILLPSFLWLIAFPFIILWSTLDVIYTKIKK